MDERAGGTREIECGRAHSVDEVFAGAHGEPVCMVVGVELDRGGGT